jgi:hypothetical protein
MPALANPRWERFAQCIVIGLLNGERKSYSQGRAYIAAGYEAKDAGKRGGSAEAAASRLNPSLSALKNFNSKHSTSSRRRNQNHCRTQSSSSRRKTR